MQGKQIKKGYLGVYQKEKVICDLMHTLVQRITDPENVEAHGNPIV